MYSKVDSTPQFVWVSSSLIICSILLNFKNFLSLDDMSSGIGY